MINTNLIIVVRGVTLGIYVTTQISRIPLLINALHN